MSGTAARAAPLDPQDGRDTYRILVLGDSLGTGLASGLKSAFKHNPRVEVIRRSHGGTGLVRDDQYDWFEAVGDMLIVENPDILVIILGGNDRQDIVTREKRYERFSSAWRKRYGQRVLGVMEMLEAYDLPVYWVGLPVVRSRRMTNDYEGFNKLYRKWTREKGFTFIDVWSRFRGPSGGYSAYGRGADGRRVRLREPDGLHFTAAGYRAYAEPVAVAIRSDMAKSGKLGPLGADDQALPVRSPAPGN